MFVDADTPLRVKSEDAQKEPKSVKVTTVQTGANVRELRVVLNETSSSYMGKLTEEDRFVIQVGENKDRGKIRFKKLSSQDRAGFTIPVIVRERPGDHKPVYILSVNCDHPKLTRMPKFRPNVCVEPEFNMSTGQNRYLTLDLTELLEMEVNAHV